MGHLSLLQVIMHPFSGFPHLHDEAVFDEV